MKAEYKNLIEMVRKGIPDKEIMKELNIQTKASLKRMYYDAKGKEEVSSQKKRVKD